MFQEDRRLRVVGQAGSVAEAVRLYPSLRPDITLLDIRLPDGDGLSALDSIKAIDPEARVLILTADTFDADIALAEKSGASGYLSKTAARPDILAAIHQAFKHGKCTPFACCRQPTPPSTAPLLTERELDVLRHMRRGLSNADIGKVLDISEQTVKTHVASLLKRLHAASRAEAVGIGYEVGLLHAPRRREGP